MPCFSPIIAWQLKNPRGKSRIFFRYVPNTEAIKLPCGRCIGCRLERSRQWAVRCVSEARMHGDNNMFITLTYSDENLPPNGSLFPRDLALFWKRLRKKYGAGIKYFACGEYGDQTERPHYHACIFGFKFPDLEVKVINDNGYPVSVIHSESLEDLWGLGHTSVGDVSFESAAYVARYCLKKILGDPQKARDHYKGREPEFMRCSKGIAASWFDKYGKQVYPLDYVVSRGHKSKPPRYFDKVLEKIDPKLLEQIKEARKSRIKEEDSVSRLNDKNALCQLKMSKKHRKL